MLSFICVPLWSQYDSIGPEALARFSFRVVDSLNAEPVQFAHVVNISKGLAVISDTLGIVHLRGLPGDTLQVSAIGFSIQRFTITEDEHEAGRINTLHLLPYVYPIGSVSVNQLGSYEQFKWRFLHIDPSLLPKEVPDIVKDYINKGLDTVAVSAPPSLGSPVTAIYMLFSKEGKSARKLAALKEKDESEREIAHKYNPELVSEVTGIEGLELYEFIDFCNFSLNFLKAASDYEIVEAILNKQKLYAKRDPRLR